MGDIWFFKRIDIGGGLDGGITVLEPQATLGGRDSETPESALAFLVARLPSSGALWVDRGGADASGATWTRLEARHLADGAARLVLTIQDKLYWTAGPELAGPPVSIGGSPIDTATLTDRWPTDRVTLTALSLNGAATTITTDSSGSFFQGGIGVSGAPPGTVMPSVEANEINAGVDGQDGTGERLRVAFRAPGGGVQLVGSAVVTVTSFFAHEGDEGRVDLFANGVLVKSLSFGAAAANPANNPDIVLSAANALGSGQYQFTITGVAFDQAEFSAVRSGLRDPSAAFDPGRGSDYYLQSISYVPVTTPVVDFDYLVEDETGARSPVANARIVSDTLPTLMLRIEDAGFVLEGHEAWFRLRLTDAAGNAVAATSATTITVAMLSGTATRGLDFQNGEAGTPSLYTVTIAAGFSDAVLRVRTFGDDEEAAITGNSDFVLEGPETFHAEIVSARSATHNFQVVDSRATATIAEGVIADPIRASVDWGTDFNWGGPAFARAISLNSRGSFEDVLDGAGVETDGGEWPIGFWPAGWDGITVNPFALLVDAGGWDLINNAPAQQVRIASQPNIGTAFAGVFPYWQTNALIYGQMRYPVNGIRWTIAEDTDGTGTGVNFVTLKQRGPDVWGGLPGSGVTIQAYDFAGSPTPYTVRWGNIQDAGILGVGDDRFITVGGANTAEEGSSERVAIGFGTLINRADFYLAEFFLTSDINRNGPQEYYSAVGLITLHRAGQQLGTWTFGMDPDAQYGTSERLPVERLIRPDIIMGYGTGYSGSYLRIEGIEFDRAEFAVQGWWTGEPTIYLSGWFPFNARYAIQSVQAMGGEVSFQYQAGIDRYGVTDWSAPVDVLLNRPLQNSYTPHTYGHSPQARVLEATTAEETSPIVFTIRLDNLTDAALLSQSAVRLRLDLTGNLTESDLGDMAAAGWTRIATDGGVYFQRDVILAAGQTQAQVPVPTVLDFLSEGAETARLRIVSAENLALGGLLIQDSLAYGRVTDGPRPFADDVATIAQLDAPNKIFWDASSQPASGAGRWMLSRSFELEQGSQGLGDVEGPIPDWGGWDAQGSEYGSMVWWKLTSQPAYGKVWSGQGLFGSFPSSGSAFTVIDVSTSWLDFDTREAWRPSWIVADKDTVLVQAAVTTAQGADAAGWAGVTLLAHGLGRSPLTNGVSFGADGVGVGSNGIEAGTGTATGETETLVALFDRVVGRAVIEIEGLAANELGRLQVYSGNGLLRDLTFGRAGSGANLILGDDNRLVLQNLIFDRLEFSAEALTGNAGQARITEGSSFLVKSIAYQSPQDVSFTYTTHDHPSGGNVSQPALVTIDVDGVAGTPDSAFAPLRLRVEPGRVFEGGSWHNPARFVLDSATPLNTNTTITYRWVNGTADRSDFWDGNASGPITVTLLAGQLSVTSEWGVFPIDDGVAEGDEFFGIEILSVTNFNRPIVVADRITEVTLSDRPQPVADAVATQAEAAPADLAARGYSGPAAAAYRSFTVETGAAAIGDDDSATPDLGGHDTTLSAVPPSFRITALPNHGTLYLESSVTAPATPWTAVAVGTAFTGSARLHWVATEEQMAGATGDAVFRYVSVAGPAESAAVEVRIAPPPSPAPMMMMSLVSMDDGVVDLSALAEEGPFAPFGTSEETPEGGEDGPLSGGSLAQQPALLDGEADLSGILDTPEQSVMLDLPSTSASDPTAPPGSPVDQAPWIEPVAPPVVVEPEYPPPGVPPE